MRRRQRGSVMLYVTIGLIGFFAFVALATETGRYWAARGQLQAASDSAALSAATSLLANNYQTVDPTASTTAAQTYGAQHAAEGVTLQILTADVQPGSWDLTTRTFTAQPGVTDPNIVRAVRVTSRRDTTANTPLAPLFGQTIGLGNQSVTAGATGYIGWAGTAGPGTVELPIGIDCCKISGSGGSACTQNYCSIIQSTPPNPCPRTSDGVMVSCLEFFATGNQNACWSDFSPSSPAVSANDLQGIVVSGSVGTIGAQAVYVDNGTKTPVVSEIFDRFHGQGAYSGNPSGTDTNADGVMDSWVMAFPTFECQNPGARCASGTPAKIVGFVCFDLQEVEVTPNKVIRGQFLCTSDTRCSNSGMGPGGNIPGTFSAQWPVLVE